MTQTHENRRVLVTPDDLLGFEIDGRYRLDSIIGGGGMGVVFRTSQRGMNRPVALKLLKLEDSKDEQRQQRFQREIEIVGQLSHPNIVRIYDSGEDTTLGLRYIAMELIDGRPLEDAMRLCRLEPALAVEIAHQICAALTDPHSMDVIHRDIKPANVLLTVRSDDTLGVKVVDFGIARETAVQGDGKITTTGIVVGSPMYMAPEAARGEQLDARTDLYSVGVLLYEMLSGAVPFSGATPMAIMVRRAVEEPPSLREALGEDHDIPQALVELVDSLVSRDPEARPASARELLRTLDEIRAEHGLKRPQLQHGVDVVDAIASWRVPVIQAPPPDDEADPYSATSRWDTDHRPASGSDSFGGWLVPESARSQLGRTLPEEAVAADTSVAEPRQGQAIGLPLVLSLLGIVVVAAIGLWVAARPAEPPQELGSSTVVAPPEQDVGPAEPRAPSNEVGTIASADAGSDMPSSADAAVDSDVTELPEGTPPQPEPAVAPPRSKARRTAERPTPKPDAGTKTKLDRELEWLKQK